MDAINNGSKEMFNGRKKARISDDSREFISELPDPILVHILSFLPTKDAIKTILLRRFGDLWRSVHVLDFDSCLSHYCENPDRCPDFLNENFVNVIRNVLNLRDSITLDKLRLKFGFTLSYSRDESFSDGFDDVLEWEKGTADQIGKLIRYAISRKVKVLDLDLKGCVFVSPHELYDLPDVLSSDYLTYLKLAAFGITSCTTIDLKSLRVLLLEDVLLNDDIMVKVLVGCPLLEDLSLIDCYGLRIFNCKNPNLKKVMLTLNTKEVGHVIISCPYVLSLEIYGGLQRALLLNFSSVVDASVFNCLIWPEQKLYHHLCCLLQEFSHCKTFSSCSWSILALAMRNMANVPCLSFEWKNLILKLSPEKWHLPGLSLLLRNSPSLETLTMCVYPGCDDISEELEAEWIQAYLLDRENHADSQEATFSCLETIMIYGHVNTPYVIQMVKFLLKSATRLQKLEVFTEKSFKPNYQSWLFHGAIERPKFTSEQLRLLSEKFESLPRASPEAKIRFS